MINKIAWTNLYKVSKDSYGNPSGSLMKVQFEICRDMLLSEIELFNPRIVVFLTGWSWGQRFLIDCENLMTNKDNQFVEFVGKINDSLIIVGQHPQGKPEYEHFEEIIKEIEMYK